MKKAILIVLGLVVLGVGGYHLLNPWAAYDRSELAKAGYPPQQSPQINTDLAYARVEGEIYSDAHNGNYTGICNSPKMVEIKNHITSLGNFTVACNESKTAWATFVTLNGNDERYWCGDSKGNRAGWEEKSANFNITTSCVGEDINSSVPVSIEAHCEAITHIPGAYPCNPSPNNKWIIYASDDGLKLIDVATGKTTLFSKSPDDRALAWFSDSQRVLGFVGSFPFSECAFNPPYSCPPDSRSIVIWDIKSETYNKIAVKTPPLSYDLEWIAPDHTARISARATDGTEGDAYYYTLDIDNKSVLLSGDYHWKPLLPAQAGLPPLVEAKRQAIYQAAISKDYDKLVAEAEGAEEVLDSLSR
ncbi:MAG: hypothetical protein M3M85_03110 [bacterium]|nr:hypothetical protein [bacterium]